MDTCFRRARSAAAAVVILASLALHPPCASAQSGEAPDTLATAPEPPSATRSVPAATDSLLVLVPIRPADEIRADLDAAHMRVADAETRAARARVLQAHARAELDGKRSEVEALDARLKIAKRDKDTAQRGEIESARRIALLERKLLERRETLRQQEIDLALAERELAAAGAAAREAELALELAREKHAQVASQPAPRAEELATVDRELQSLEQRTLAAQIDEAARRESYARREAELAKARLRVLDAHIKLMQSGGTP